MLFEWARLVVGGILLLTGIVIFYIELYGIFRQHYVLNRMHMAALGDTLGIGFSLVGLVVISGLNVTTLKLILVVFFFWCASPVSSHLVANLELTTARDLKKHITGEIDLAMDHSHKDISLEDDEAEEVPDSPDKEV